MHGFWHRALRHKSFVAGGVLSLVAPVDPLDRLTTVSGDVSSISRGALTASPGSVA